MSKIHYPPTGFRFDVKIVDLALMNQALKLLNITNKGQKLLDQDASFREVSGITVEIPTEEVYEGGENRFAHHLPKPPRFTPLVLKRGLVVKGSVLGEWAKITTETGFSLPIVPLKILLNLKGEENETLMSWLFLGAYPTKWDVSGFDAMNNQLLVETLELTYKRFETVPNLF